jgi:hypothetical protein
MRRAARILVWTVVAATVLGLIAAVVWPLPEILTNRLSVGVEPADRLNAVNDVRATLVGLLAGIAAFASITLGLRTYRLTRSGQFTDRYSRAVQQLGSDQLSVRLGGIYALERLAQDSSFDRHAVTEVLGALIRGSIPVAERGGDPTAAADAQAAVKVLGRTWATKRPIRADLTGARLCGADLRGLNLRGARLVDADLSMSQMQNTNLKEADLSGADLRGAVLDGAVLSKARLDGADIRGASIASVVASNSDIRSARAE